MRRVTNPAQTLWDGATGTTVLEDFAAIEGILGEDAELKRDGPYCGRKLSCLTGVSVLPGSTATTAGHTVRFADSDPEKKLVAHETQHVLDLEDTGGQAFYRSYIADYALGILSGESHHEAYDSILWEKRATEVEEHYPYQGPSGIGTDLFRQGLQGVTGE